MLFIIIRCQQQVADVDEPGGLFRHLSNIVIGQCFAIGVLQDLRRAGGSGIDHTDFERGFIRAEVIAFEDMKACGTMANAKSKGLVRSEGKEYVMKDGDIVNFLFNV